MLTLAALAVMATLSIEGDANASNPPLQIAPQAAQTGEPVQLEDIEVTGRPLDQMIREFIDVVAEPNNRRGLARWDKPVCVAVTGLTVDGAQYLADRISTVAADVGLEVGQPGCRANLIVIGTTNGNATARSMVQERPRSFNLGGTGTNRSRAALEDFQAADRPVRWWQIAMPTDSWTGWQAVRLPGECDQQCNQRTGSALGYAPTVALTSASNQRTQIVDNLQMAVVIVDVDQVSGLSALQLADYIAMVSLAQIDPDADTAAYGSILNVIDDPEGSATLTHWDLAYLQGLYRSNRGQVHRTAAMREIANSIHRQHRALREAEADPAQ